MTRPGNEPRSSGPLANTLPTWSMSQVLLQRIQMIILSREIILKKKKGTKLTCNNMVTDSRQKKIDSTFKGSQFTEVSLLSNHYIYIY